MTDDPDTAMLHAFARKYRLTVTQNECDESVIRGRHADLYMDGGQLCMVGLDAVVSPTALRALHPATLRTGDMWRDLGGNLRRDFIARGIPESRWTAAIALAGCSRKRITSTPAPNRRRRARRTPQRPTPTPEPIQPAIRRRGKHGLSD